MYLLTAIGAAILVFLTQLFCELGIFQSILSAFTMFSLCIVLHPNQYSKSQNLLVKNKRKALKEIEKVIILKEESKKNKTNFSKTLNAPEYQDTTRLMEFIIIVKILRTIGIILIPWFWPSAVIILFLNAILAHVKLNKWIVLLIGIIISMVIGLGGLFGQWGVFNIDLLMPKFY